MIKVTDKLKQMLAGVLMASLTVLGVLFYQLPDNKFHIYFLDVGQGDSVLIKTPENHQILVDSGPGNAVTEELAKVMSFFDRSIDLIILTHPDKDHVEGFIDVLDKYKVQNILMTGVQKESGIYEKLLEKIRSENAKVFFAEAEIDFKFNEVILDILYPLEQLFAENPKESNNAAIALRVAYRNKVILLTADVDESVEKILLNTYKDLKADIFKAGHHGSKTSNAEDFLRKVKPAIVVIQSGKNNGYGHPHKEVLERLVQLGIEVRRTDLEGMLEFSF